MAEQRRPRLSAYGAPLSPLSDVRRQYEGDSPSNKEHIRQILAMLEAQWLELLRRGMYAELHLLCRISDGILQNPTEVQVTHFLRLPKE